MLCMVQRVYAVYLGWRGTKQNKGDREKIKGTDRNSLSHVTGKETKEQGVNERKERQAKNAADLKRGRKL